MLAKSFALAAVVNGEFERLTLLGAASIVFVILLNHFLLVLGLLSILSLFGGPLAGFLFYLYYYWVSLRWFMEKDYINLPFNIMRRREVRESGLGRGQLNAPWLLWFLSGKRRREPWDTVPLSPLIFPSQALNSKFSPQTDLFLTISQFSVIPGSPLSKLTYKSVNLPWSYLHLCLYLDKAYLVIKSCRSYSFKAIARKHNSVWQYLLGSHPHFHSQYHFLFIFCTGLWHFVSLWWQVLIPFWPLAIWEF